MFIFADVVVLDFALRSRVETALNGVSWRISLH
jgi:hypothetical protein